MRVTLIGYGIAVGTMLLAAGVKHVTGDADIALAMATLGGVLGGKVLEQPEAFKRMRARSEGEPS